MSMPLLLPIPSKKREGFFNQIYNFANINLTKRLCGDFNCVENPILDRYQAKNTTISESKLLAKFWKICKMFDCPIQLQSTKHTFFSENSSSRIDRIYATNDVKAVSARVSPKHFSNHIAFVVQVDIAIQVSRGKGYQNETFLKASEMKWKT